MIERGRKRFRAAAVTHVHADHIHSGGPRFAAGADHILRKAGSFQSVNDDGGSTSPAPAASDSGIALARLRPPERVALRAQASRLRGAENYLPESWHGDSSGIGEAQRAGK